jgi:hypothetical protein
LCSPFPHPPRGAPLAPSRPTQVKSGEQLEAKVAELKAKLDDVTGNYNFMAQKVRRVGGYWALTRSPPESPPSSD